MLNFLAAIGSAPGGGGGSFESIATIVANGSQSTLTFSSIPSTYQHLQIRAISRDTYTAIDGTSTIGIRFNNDSGNNYAFHSLVGNGSAAQASGFSNQPSIGGALGNLLGSAPGANIRAVSILDIHDYASTTKNKTTRSFYGADVNISSTAYDLRLVSGLWMSTAAINTITLFASATAFTSGSTFALYGIKGA